MRNAGFRLGSRGPFVSAKGLKAIDAPAGPYGTDGRRSEGASQLATLTQGPLGDKSVRL